MNAPANHMNVGSEWMIDARGCDAGRLSDLAHMRALCERVVSELELIVIGGGQWHQFPAPGGVTGLYLLSESHLACHTYPELGVATFNLYCCRARPRWPWEARLREALGASDVSVKLISRDAVVESIAGHHSALEVANS